MSNYTCVHTTISIQLCVYMYPYTPINISSQIYFCFFQWYLNLQIFSRLESVSRVARWFILKPKNPNLGKFCRALDGKRLRFLCPYGIFNGDWGYFMTIWYILYSFGTFFRFWYHIHKKKNLATLSVRALTICILNFM
jgi:hypothetical protein